MSSASTRSRQQQLQQQQQQQQQQTLTEFFAAKKSIRPRQAKQQASQAIELLKQVDADLGEVLKAKKSRRSPDISTKETTPPAFQRYANLLEPKADISVPSSKHVDKTTEESQNQVTAPSKEISRSAKSALSRLEAKRALLKSANEKLRQFKKDQAALQEFQAKTQRVREVVPIAVPAYEKYHYLSVPVSVLPMPVHYQRLLDGFGACDSVVSMFHNRNEICRFNKLSTAVRSMTRHEFGLPQLGKILHLKPEAYIVTVERHRFLDTAETMHHIVAFSDPPQGQNPKFVLERKSDFRDKLMLRVAQYHQEFLDKEMPGSDVPVEALKRWHPKFSLDSVPDIPEKELPKLESIAEPAKAKDVLDKVRGKYSARIEKALESLAEKQAQESAKPTESSPVSNASLKVTGVSQSLLDRIRKKETLKMAERMVIGGNDEKERRLLRALPVLIRAIRQVFLTSKKTTLSYSDLTAKIRSSGSFDDLEVLMARVAEIAPEWYKPLTVRNVKYIKIDKERDVNSLCERVERMLKEVGSCKGV